MMRHSRVRSLIIGSAHRPRLCVFKSNESLFVQLIDDAKSTTLASLHQKKVVVDGIDVGERKGKVAFAYALGMMIAKYALEKNISSVVFDRGGYRYHGRIKAVAEGARSGGLVF